MRESLKLLFTGVGIILFWRGIWLAADTYLFPEEEDVNISIAISVLAGAGIIIWMKHKNI
jgi:hypothetical protein